MFKPLENVAYYKENKQNLGKRRLPFANIKGKKTDKPGQNVHRLLWSIIFGVKAHCAFEVSYTAPPSFTNWWFDFAYNFLIGDNGLNCSSISTQIITDLCVWIRTNWWYLAPNNICSMYWIAYLSCRILQQCHLSVEPLCSCCPRIGMCQPANTKMNVKECWWNSNEWTKVHFEC